MFCFNLMHSQFRGITGNVMIGYVTFVDALGLFGLMQ